MDTDDDALIKGLKRGDENAFCEIYERYHNRLYGVAKKYLRSKKLAEDAIHDTFLKLWHNRQKLSTSGSLKGFLFTTIKNHVLNIINHDKRKIEKYTKFSYQQKMQREASDNVIAISEYRDQYDKAVERLPEKRREIFYLRTEEGLTSKETAQYLGVSIHTVKSQYYKATKSIRRYVDKNIKRGTGT